MGTSGDIVAVGSEGGGANSSVHVYRKLSIPLGVDIPDDYLSWEHIASLFPEGDLSAVNFGISIASSQAGLIVVGAPLRNANDSDSGKVYVFQPSQNLTQWTLLTTLNPYNAETASPSFGSSVAIENDFVIVGAVSDQNGTGSVTIFDIATTESIITKFSPEELTVGASFGSSLSIHQDTLAVGAPQDGIGGSVYVYQKIGYEWLPHSRLTPRDTSPGDAFGIAVAVSGCSIAVSASGDESAAESRTGSVRIFNYDPESDYWLHDQIVEAEDENAGQIFGHCIAMKDNYLLVGAPWGGELDDSSGVTYRFEREDGLWVKKVVILNPDPTPGEEFGCALALSGNLAVVGAKSDSSISPSRGSAYVFDLCPALS